MTTFEQEKDFPLNTRWLNKNDGYIGRVIGYYITHEKKKGVVLQLDTARVVHVYQLQWLVKAEEGVFTSPQWGDTF